MHARRNALLLLHLVVFIWGFTGILGKLIQQSTLHLVYTRTVIGMVGLALAAWWMRSNLSPRTPDLKHYLLTGLIITGHWITFYGAIKLSTASIAAACLSTSTVFTALMEPFWFKRKIRMYEVVLGVVVVAALFLIFGLETERSMKKKAEDLGLAIQKNLEEQARKQEAIDRQDALANTLREKLAAIQ